MDGNGTKRPEPVVYTTGPVPTQGMDIRGHTTIGVGFGDAPQCEAFLNHQARYGWRLTSVSEGPPWRRDCWLTIERPVAAWTDGLGPDGEPLRRVVYRVIGRRRDLVDRGETQRIEALVAAGWRIVATLRAEPWAKRPVTFLEHDDVDLIEVVREGESVAPKREAALAKIVGDGRYDIEVVDVDAIEAQLADDADEDDEGGDA